ncbi:MAG: hypothetical protein QMD66_00290 [Actinomycetota bacterium]|nr:hypothetical protein [Actinomycetota bacterium]MDI6821310.1 hypothetical protein [Actinomycetota bacterium]
MCGVSGEILKAVKAEAKEGKISCPQARKLAEKLKVSPLEVGRVANHLGIKIYGCELGCF